MIIGAVHLKDRLLEDSFFLRLCKLVHEVKILTNQEIPGISCISCTIPSITRKKQSVLRSVV